MSVNTKRVMGRRDLTFRSYAELLADLDRVEAGPAKTLGNWSIGQICRHLARIYNGSIDGYPLKAPWVIRLGARLFKNRILRGKLPPGFQLPARAAAVLVPGPTGTHDGMTELREAIARLQTDPRRADHPIFGRLGNEEWDRLHLAHAGLHLSFVIVG